MLADAVWYVPGQGQEALNDLKRLPEDQRGREAYGLVYRPEMLPTHGGLIKYEESGMPASCFFMMRRVPGFTKLLPLLSTDPAVGLLNIVKRMELKVQPNGNVYGYFREGVEQSLADSKEAQDEREARHGAEVDQLYYYRLKEVISGIRSQIADCAPVFIAFNFLKMYKPKPDVVLAAQAARALARAAESEKEVTEQNIQPYLEPLAAIEARLVLDSFEDDIFNGIREGYLNRGMLQDFMDHEAFAAFYPACLPEVAYADEPWSIEDVEANWQAHQGNFRKRERIDRGRSRAG